MPTLDDIKTLRKNVAIAANDGLALSDKDGTGGTPVQQVPAFLLSMGYTHAWRIDYDHPTLAANTDAHAVIGLHTFTVGSVLTKCGAVVITGYDDTAAPSVITGVQLDVGVDYSDGTTDDPDGYIEAMTIGANNNQVFRQNTGALLNKVATDELLNTGHAHTTPNILEAVITTSGSGEDETDNLGQGSIVIMAQIIEPTEFDAVIPAHIGDVTAGGAG